MSWRARTRRAASVLVVERTRRRASTRRWLMCSTIWRGLPVMTCGARPSSTCSTSFQTRRRGTTIVIGICIGDEGSTSGRRQFWSGRRCAWLLPLGGAGFSSGRRRLPNSCSVLKPSTVARARRGAFGGLVGAAGRSWCSWGHLYAYSERQQSRDQNGQHTHQTIEVGASHGPACGHSRAKLAAHSSLPLSRGTKSGVRLWRDLNLSSFLVLLR